MFDPNIWYGPAAPPPPVMVMVPFLVLVPAAPVGMGGSLPSPRCGNGGDLLNVCMYVGRYVGM